MTRSTAGATGKSTSSFVSDIVNFGSVAPNPRVSMVGMSARVAKISEISDRNKVRAEQRAAGAQEVSDDEEVSGSEFDNDEEVTAGKNLDEEDEFLALQNLSPADFKVAMEFALKRAAEASSNTRAGPDAINLVPAPVAPKNVFNCHAIVFRVADEVSGNEIPRQEVPDCIWKLVQAGVPLSLPCITTSSLRYIHNNPTSVKTARSADGVSQSKELMLNMSAFGAGEDITQADWQDAWINRLEIIKKTSERDIYKYFKNHKNFISQQEDFADEFEAFKRFNIRFCRHYMNTCFKLSEQQYYAKILEFKLKFSQASFAAQSFVQGPSSRVPSQSHSSSSRFKPYVRAKSSSNSPFSKGTESSVQAGQCLICGRTGHRGSNCSFPCTEKGVRVASCWRNSRVSLISSGAEACFQWNLRSECRGSHRASDHFCSVCGAKDHSLPSRKCF